MADLQAFANFVRIGKPAVETANDLGPLTDLLGTWVGNKGLNVIAVPRDKSFDLLHRPYTEQITFLPIGAPVPNRPHTFVYGVSYELRVADAETNMPMHIENGMWLNIADGALPGGPTIARMAAIPHGNSVMALGSHMVAAGAPIIQNTSTIPLGPFPPGMLGYVEPYTLAQPYVANPNLLLQQAIAHQTIVETTTLNVSTANGGGILNIPFVLNNVNTTAFSAIYWIEKVKNPATNAVTMQLQYTQQSDINFLHKPVPPGGLIMWPHVNVNTLTKQ
jgi:hypothetical protein